MKQFRFWLAVVALSVFAACDNGPDDGGGLPVPKAHQDASQTTVSSIRVMWSEVAGAAAYEYVFDDGDAVRTEATEALFTGLTPGDHRFRIRAVAAEGSGRTNSKWSADLTVATADARADAFTVTVDPQRITFYDAYVSIVPADNSMYYYVSYVDKDVLDYMGSDQAYVDEVIASIRALAELSGKTFGDMFIALRQSGEGTYWLRNLGADKEYYAYAFGFDIDGNITASMVKSYFRTAPDPGVPDSDMTFAIDITGKTGTAATIAVQPSVNDEWYFFAAVHVNRVPATDDAGVLAYYVELFNDYLEDESFDEFARDNLSKGPDSYTYHALEPGNDYRVYAFGVAHHGDRIVATTKLKSVDFTSAEEEPQPGDALVNVSIVECSATHIKAVFTPQTGVSYFCDVVRYDSYKEMSDEQIIAKFLADNEWGLGYILQSGVYESRNYNDYPADTEYLAFAFAVDDAYQPISPLYKEVARTLAQ